MGNSYRWHCLPQAQLMCCVASCKSHGCLGWLPTPRRTVKWEWIEVESSAGWWKVCSLQFWIHQPHTCKALQMCSLCGLQTASCLLPVSQHWQAWDPWEAHQGTPSSRQPPAVSSASCKDVQIKCQQMKWCYCHNLKLVCPIGDEFPSWNVQQQLIKCAQDQYRLHFSILCFKCWNNCFERNISCFCSFYSEHSKIFPYFQLSFLMFCCLSNAGVPSFM